MPEETATALIGMVRDFELKNNAKMEVVNKELAELKAAPKLIMEKLNTIHTELSAFKEEYKEGKEANQKGHTEIITQQKATNGRVKSLEIAKAYGMGALFMMGVGWTILTFIVK